MAEKYFNLFQTTVGVAGYTSGSGTLAVASTTGITLNAGDTCRLLIYRVISTVVTPIVLLKCTAVTDSTDFAVTAEGADASALSGDIVINVLSAGGMDQIRKDIATQGAYASAAQEKQGNLYFPTDSPIGVRFDNGSAFINVGLLPALTDPTATSFSNFNMSASGVVNPSITSTKGRMILDDGTTGTGNDHWCGQELGSYPSTPFSITAIFLSELSAYNYGSFGLYIRDSASPNKFVIAYFVMNGSLGNPYNWSVGAAKWNSTTSVSGNYVAQGAPIWPLGVVTLKIRDDGTNFYFYYSIDFGATFRLMYQKSRSDFISTPAAVGFALNANHQTWNWAGSCQLISWAQGT